MDLLTQEIAETNEDDNVQNIWTDKWSCNSLDSHPKVNNLYNIIKAKIMAVIDWVKIGNEKRTITIWEALEKARQNPHPMITNEWVHFVIEQ